MDIEAITWRIIEKYCELSVPVNVYEISRKMGVELVSDPSLPVSGEFSLEEKNKPLIKVNTSKSHLCQRFTLAHELGHFALNHGPAFRDPASNFSGNIWDKKEVEANKFAAALLMPEPAVRFFVDKEKITSIEKLAKYFDVSTSGMIYRLKDLKIFLRIIKRQNNYYIVCFLTKMLLLYSPPTI